MFDPSIGRWIEEDPEGFEAGDVNLYRYVENNPVNHLDPSGLEEMPGATAAPGLIINWGLQIVAGVAAPAPKPEMPGRDVPEWGRDTVKWGGNRAGSTAAEDAAARAREITAAEARALDAEIVKQVRDWYWQVYRNNPANRTAFERYKLMQRILELQKGRWQRIAEHAIW